MITHDGLKKNTTSKVHKKKGNKNSYHKTTGNIFHPHPHGVDITTMMSMTRESASHLEPLAGHAVVNNAFPVLDHLAHLNAPTPSRGTPRNRQIGK